MVPNLAPVTMCLIVSVILLLGGLNGHHLILTWFIPIHYNALIGLATDLKRSAWDSCTICIAIDYSDLLLSALK